MTTTTTTTDRTINGYTWKTNTIITRKGFALLKTVEPGIWSVYDNSDWRYSWSTTPETLRPEDYRGQIEVNYEKCRATLAKGDLPNNATLYSMMRAANELDG